MPSWRMSMLVPAALFAGSFLGGCTSGALQSTDSHGFSFASVLASVTTDETALNLVAGEDSDAEAISPTRDTLAEAPVVHADPAESDRTGSKQAAQGGSGEAPGAEEPAPEEPALAEASVQPAKKKGFLAAFWSGQSRTEDPAPAANALATPEPKTERVQLSDSQPRRTETLARSFRTGEDALPGVRTDTLFEITRKSGLDDVRDIDLNEDDGSYRVASAAGLARLAPNGLLKQRADVDVSCLKPSLVRMLRTVERRFGQRVIVTSGYRGPAHNKRVRGAPRSLHMACAAADIQVPGVSKWELARFVRSLPERGGVGTYCHTASIHVDVGPERDWNWRCRRKA